MFIDGGTLTAHRYIEEVLVLHVVPYAHFVGGAFLLTHVNDRAHAARCVMMQYLDEVGVNRIEWPARSPDLNPIEHIWDRLGRLVRNRIHVPSSLQELRVALQEEWNNMDQMVIHDLVNGENRRLAAAI